VELDIAMLDGCKIQWLSSPKEIIGEEGKVKALVCDTMKLVAPDYSGKPAPIATGETITIEVDMVIKATGQSPFIDLINENGIENNRGKILMKENNSTSIEGVFAGGDCVNGGKEVVDAVQSGKEGAAAILEYLSRKDA
jgi:dihydropyrimidine dehydrogenase (NAD+) subunit PreT